MGDRRTMLVYDCDDPAHLDTLATEVRDSDLVGRLEVQTFAPDTLDEARNRGFHPV